MVVLFTFTSALLYAPSEVQHSINLMDPGWKLLYLLWMMLTFLSSTIFVYKSYECVMKYFDYQVVTKFYEEYQQDYPYPEFCILPNEVQIGRMRELNLTEDDYKEKGIWHVNGSNKDGEELFNFFSVPLNQLIDKVRLYLTIGHSSHEYQKKSLIINGDDISGVSMKTCDYYNHLRCNCMMISAETAPFGLQAVSIYPKENCKMIVSAPGRFYTPAQKKAKITFLAGHNYVYSIEQIVSKHLPIGLSPCNEELNWKEDECKLRILNDILIKRWNCTAPWLLRFARFDIVAELVLAQFQSTKDQLYIQRYLPARYTH